jgi:hypothetical protein
MIALFIPGAPAAAEAAFYIFFPDGFFENFQAKSNEGARLVDDAPFPCDAHTALLRLCGVHGCLTSPGVPDPFPPDSWIHAILIR